jgi:hypothetical protein
MIYIYQYTYICIYIYTCIYSCTGDKSAKERVCGVLYECSKVRGVGSSTDIHMGGNLSLVYQRRRRDKNTVPTLPSSTLPKSTLPSSSSQGPISIVIALIKFAKSSDDDSCLRGERTPLSREREERSLGLEDGQDLRGNIDSIIGGISYSLQSSLNQLVLKSFNY